MTVVRIGCVLSRENNTLGTPTLCVEWKAIRQGAPALAPGRPAHPLVGYDFIIALADETLGDLRR